MTPVQQARAYLENRIEEVAAFLLPGGKKAGSEWLGMRKAQGGPGDSVCIHIAKDSKLGLCSFFASGESGTSDIVATWMRLRGIPVDDWERFFSDIRSFAGQDFGYGSNGSNGHRKPPKPFAHWDQCVADVTDEDLEALADWRSLSIEYVTWLRDQKLIGRYEEFWAFPVMVDGVVTAIHYVLESITPDEKDRWFYEPRGSTNALFVIGDLARAEFVHAFESQWDLLAVDDILGVHRSEKWALVATRGVQHAKLLGQLPPTIKGVKLWPQNDPPGHEWMSKAANFLKGRTVKAVQVSDKFKDVAEWVEAGADKEMLEAACRDATEIQTVADPVLEQVRDAEAAAEQQRFKAFTKATVKGADLLKIDIPPRQIIIKDWLKEGDLGFIFAYRGSGKTWLALALMSALAEGLVCGPWLVHEEKMWPILYVDGEMPVDDIRSRIKAINGGRVPENFHLLNHEILYSQSELVINLASPKDQGLITKICMEKQIKVLLLDNLGCLFTGVGENDADEWEKVLPWLLQLRRAMITVIIIHHTGVNTTRMRGTSKREDAAAWVMRLDDKKDGNDQAGARFVTRFIKYRGCQVVPDYEWSLKPADDVIALSCKEASRAEVLLQHIITGVDNNKDLSEAMGLPKWTVSKLVKTLIDQRKIQKIKGGRYEAI